MVQSNCMKIYGAIARFAAQSKAEAPKRATTNHIERGPSARSRRQSLFTGFIISSQKRNCSHKHRTVPKFGGADLNLAPGRPRVLVHIGLDVRNDNVCALHYTAANQNHLRIVCMNQADGGGRPDIQTAIANRNGDRVSTCSFFKKL